MRVGAFEDARAEFEAAMAAARALGVMSELAGPAWQLARLDIEEGDLDSALVNLDTAAAAARLGAQLLLDAPRDAMTEALDAGLYSPARF